MKQKHKPFAIFFSLTLMFACGKQNMTPPPPSKKKQKKQQQQQQQQQIKETKAGNVKTIELRKIAQKSNFCTFHKAVLLLL